ncbi:MAG: RES family NAD+ phosphorylase [Prolixibacteraceae bacterium]|nr:RES family NAD+ phosphorylase [Prolixibacteraceae bacterium]
MKVCDQCFNDNEIKQFIVATSTEYGTCECCLEEGNLIDVNEIMDFFSEFISIFKYDDVNGEPLINVLQGAWGIFSSSDIGLKILSDFDVSLTLELVLGLNLPGSGFNPKIPVSYIDEIIESVSFWTKLKDDLKWKRRFLTDIDEMTELGWDAMFNVFVILDSQNKLYRARINQNEQTTAYSDIQMYAPPNTTSTAGRANPQGIPYLYLSKTLETTLYEARASFLDNISIGIFHIKDGFEAKLVDFTNKTSPFNNMGDIINFTKARLLREVISQDLSKPLRRYDSELEYIPTQFICEYIRFFTGAEGIQFYSSLEKDGINVVLFDQENIICSDVELHQITEVTIKSKRII